MRRTSLLAAVLGLALVLTGTAGPAAAATPSPMTTSQGSGDDYVAMTPTRILSDGTVPPSTVRCFPVAGKAGIPTDARGIYVNVTTVRPNGPGFVVAFPDTQGNGRTPMPTGSTVNFEPGQDVANSTFIALPSNGRICYGTRGATRVGVLMDVAGYLPAGSDVITQAPTRLLDTRGGSYRVGKIAGPVQPRRAHTVKVTGNAGVPGDASAVILNVTTVGARLPGHVRVYPAGQNPPNASVVNYAPGVDKANGTIVALSPSGEISFYSDTAPTSQSPVQIVLDVVGYVKKGSSYEAMTPTRIVDTRGGTQRIGPVAGPLRGGTVTSVLVGGQRGVPAGAAAVVLNVTAISPSSLGHLRVYPNAGSTDPSRSPNASAANYVPGRAIPNLVVVALPANGRINFHTVQSAGATVHLAVDVVGYVVGSSGAGPTQPGWAVEALTPEKGIFFGAASERTGSHSSAEEAIADFERTVGRKMDVHRTYSQWDEPSPSRELSTTVQRGRIPAHSIAPRLANGTRLSWRSVAEGKHDARIREHARAMKGLDVPLYLTFQHEPELALAHGTPAEYRAAWRHMVEVFRDEGADNVVWTWVVTPTVFSARGTVRADDIYPGDDVVDYLAVNIYNWFACTSNNNHNEWKGFEELATGFREWAKPRGKPLMVSEYGSNEDRGNPQRKGRWLRDAMDTFVGWPEMKVALYFNVRGSCDWLVDSSSTTLNAFREIGARTTAHQQPQAWLKSTTTHGAAPLRVTFDGAGSTGMHATNGKGIASWELSFSDGTATRKGTGQPPASIAHTFSAGEHTVTLRVTDTGGRTAQDTVAVQAAPAPDVRFEPKSRTSTSVSLEAYVNMHNFEGTVTYEWGPTEKYGNKSTPIAVERVPWERTVPFTITGLKPGTDYHVRVTATSPAGTKRVTGIADTQGPPTTSRSFTNNRTATAVQFNAQVDPHRLETQAWIEWGTTTSLGNRAPVRTLRPVSYEVTVPSGVITGLKAGTTYYWRVVARNSLGELKGPISEVTTARS